MPSRIEVKICGLTRRQDAEAAAALGAGYLGVVLTPGFARSVSTREAGPLLAGLSVTPVAVLVDEAPARAEALARTLGAGVIQLHGSEAPEAVAELARRGPWRLWKSVRARDPDDVREAAERYGPWVHGILVEGAREGVLGGGGARLDPASFPDLRSLVPAPLRLILAGGLRAETVAAAVDHFAPDVVDVSSGVEVEPGRKGPELVGRFIQEALRARPQAAGPGTPDRTGAPT